MLKPSWLRLSSVAALPCLWFLTSPFGGRAMLNILDHLSPGIPIASCPTADAIVVLSGNGAPRPEPWPKRMRLSRSEAGMELLRAGKAQHLVFTQGGVEAVQSRNAALQAGLKPEHILLLGSAEDTAQEARLIGLAAARLKWKRIILVTSGYHMPRATILVQYSARKNNREITVIPFPADSGKFLFPMAGIREFLPSVAGSAITWRAIKELAGPLICRLGLC